MKFARKSIVSTVIALSMMTVFSVPAYAVDYGTSNPGYTTPDKVVEKDPTPEAPTKVVSDNTVKDAVSGASKGDTVTINADGDKAMLTEDAVAAIVAAADKGVDVKLEVKDETVGKVELTISNVTEAKAIDLTMGFRKTEGEQTIEIRGGADVTVPKNSLIITPATSGSFGMDVTMTLDSSVIKGMKTKNVKLYHVSDEGKVTDQTSSLNISKDGKVSITISHASSYVLTDQVMAVDEDSDDDFDVDDGDDDDAYEDDDDDADYDSDDDDSSVDGSFASNDDSNPGTGVALVVVPALLAAAASAATFKKKK